MIWLNCAKFLTKVPILKLLANILNDAIQCLTVPPVPTILRALSNLTQGVFFSNKSLNLRRQYKRASKRNSLWNCRW
jgi:hypothetical protein